MSKKVTLSADGTTATVANATFGDILTTAVSTDSAVTGMYGLIQRGAFLLTGMVVQNVRLGNGINPFKA